MKNTLTRAADMHTKKQTNFRLSDDSKRILEEIARRTHRDKTDVVEYAVAKLAAQWTELAAEACKLIEGCIKLSKTE